MRILGFTCNHCSFKTGKRGKMEAFRMRDHLKDEHGIVEEYWGEKHAKSIMSKTPKPLPVEE